VPYEYSSTTTTKPLRHSFNGRDDLVDLDSPGGLFTKAQTAVACATSQTVCDRHRTCDTTYSRNASQNLRPVARAIIYATSYIRC